MRRLCILAVLAQAACSGDADVGRAPVASVAISPNFAVLFPGMTLRLAATARDAGNLALADRPVTWGSSTGSVATVSTDGVVTAVSPGSATIIATSEGRSTTGVITVIPAPVTSVSIEPSQPTIPAGSTVTLIATALDANGHVLAGRPFGWASDRPGVASVSASGAVTGVSRGVATITVTSESVTAAATVTVSSEPVAFVSVSPATGSVAAGSVFHLTATTRASSFL